MLPRFTTPAHSQSHFTTVASDLAMIPSFLHSLISTAFHLLDDMKVGLGYCFGCFVPPRESVSRPRPVLVRAEEEKYGQQLQEQHASGRVHGLYLVTGVVRLVLLYEKKYA
jgi:hypothetical protein